MGGLRKLTVRLFRKSRRMRGFSLIEVMIAGGLIAFIAVAILPAVFSVVDSSKSTGFKAICTGAVRAKLQEYLNGVVDTTSAGAIDGANAYAPSGFEYTKNRFLNNWTYCNTNTPNLNPGQPGFRETVYGNAVKSANYTEFVPGTTNQFAVMEGFQLYVLIRHYNPRKLVDSSGNLAPTTGTPARDCSWQYDQFYRLGDALEVTVTGMARTDPSASSGGRNCNGVGKLWDIGHSASCSTQPEATRDALTPNPLLTCSATEIVYPPHFPFRYYLGPDGKIRNYQASISFSGTSIQSSAQAMETHFRSIWVQNGATTIAGTVADPNIRSFAVSPDNQWVFVLRPGELARYGPCSDAGSSVSWNTVTLTPTGGSVQPGGAVTLDNITYNGTPDCPKLPSISIGSPAAAVDGKTWAVNQNIANIAVDFGTTQDTWNSLGTIHVYGLLEGASTLASGNSGLLELTLNANGTVTEAESTLFTLPANRPRIRGMFIAQTFPSVTGAAQNLFFFDNTCYTSGSTAVTSSTYCASIFNSADSNMQQDARELPSQVEAISY